MFKGSDCWFFRRSSTVESVPGRVSGFTYSLHCSSFLGLPCGIHNIELVVEGVLLPRFPSSTLIRVPLSLLFGVNKGTQKKKKGKRVLLGNLVPFSIEMRLPLNPNP